MFVRYSGWSDKWNEWHDVTSHKILRLGTKTTRKQIEDRLKKKPLPAQNNQPLTPHSIHPAANSTAPHAPTKT